jgi:hypothetical protein
VDKTTDINCMDLASDAVHFFATVKLRFIYCRGYLSSNETRVNMYDKVEGLCGLF